MAIALPDDIKEEIASSIQRYFLEEREEEIGGLQASILLDFVLKEIGPSFYNQGVRDAQAALQGVVADLDSTLFEPEFGYTAERRSQRSARRSAGR
jgi:uncharacterized protein (DUF2164 family)